MTPEEQKADDVLHSLKAKFCEEYSVDDMIYFWDAVKTVQNTDLFALLY